MEVGRVRDSQPVSTTERTRHGDVVMVHRYIVESPAAQPNQQANTRASRLAGRFPTAPAREDSYGFINYFSLGLSASVRQVRSLPTRTNAS